MTVLEIIAAALLTVGSVLLIRAVIAADQAAAPDEPSQARQEPRAGERPLRRAA